jgi:hypothetical protein
MDETRAEQTMNGWLNKVPGYGGYRDKETRRDLDRQVRDRLVAELATRAESVERRAQVAADERRLQEVGPLNDLAGSIRHLSNRINSATYGYGGLFGSKDVNADVLDQIRLFDQALVSGLDAIDATLPALQGAGGESLVNAVSTARRSVDQMSAQFDLRSQVVENAIPATREQTQSVLDVLMTSEQQKTARAPYPAYDLHDRDALAILGDNYVVDARIDVESAGATFRLFRISETPEQWLFVSRSKETPLALLTRSQAIYVPGDSPVIGEEAFVVDASGHGSGDVVGAGGQSSRRAVAYTLLRGATDQTKRAIVLQWGAEQQVYSGSQVHPDDLEIFGKP